MALRMSGHLRWGPSTQDAVEDRRRIHLIEAGNDQVGLGSLQQGLITKPRDTYGSHAPGARGCNAGWRVLDDHTVGWWHLQSLRRQQEKRRIRLAARHVRAAQVGIKDRQQWSSVGRAQTAQHGCDVLRRGGQCQPQAGRVQGTREAHRVRKGLEAALGDQSID